MYWGIDLKDTSPQKSAMHKKKMCDITLEVISDGLYMLTKASPGLPHTVTMNQLTSDWFREKYIIVQIFSKTG